MLKISKKIAIIFSSLLVFSCSANNNSLENTIQAEPNNSNISSNNSRTIDKTFAKEIFEALDLNKNGVIDATEAPIIIGEANKDPLAFNFQLVSANSSIKNYDLINEKSLKANKAITINNAVDKFMKNKDSVLTIYNAKISESNKNKIVTNLSKVLLKDKTNEGNRINCFAKEIGYTTKKAFYTVSKIESSLLPKKIEEQFKYDQGTDISYGSLTIYRNAFAINNHESRIAFYDYSSFTRNLPKTVVFEFINPTVSQ